MFAKVPRPLLLVFTFFALVMASCTATPETITVEVTREVFIISTPEPSPTSTNTPEPRVLFEDGFEEGSGEWFVNQTDDYDYDVVDGYLRLEMLSANVFQYLSHPGLEFQGPNVLEYDLTYISGATDAAAGVGIRCTGQNEYWVEIDTDANGFFSLWRVGLIDDEFDFQLILDWVSIPELNRGTITNHFRIEDGSTEIAIYINDALVVRLPYDDTPPGCPAFFLATYDEGGSVWAFDNVTQQEYSR